MDNNDPKSFIQVCEPSLLVYDAGSASLRLRFLGTAQQVPIRA
jgi:hypothetical protein